MTPETAAKAATLDDILLRALDIARIHNALLRAPGGLWLPPGYDYLQPRRQAHYRVWTPSVYGMVEQGMGTLSGSLEVSGGIYIATRFDLAPAWSRQ